MNKRKENKTVVTAVTWLGTIVNILLSASKFVIGICIGSQTLIADGVHSLSDLISDAALLIGLHFWSAPPDAEHPYGHERIETLTTALIGLLLGGAAVGIAYHAISSFFVENLDSTHRLSPWLVAFMLFAIGVKEGLYWITVFYAKRIESTALYANAWHHRSDAFSSIPALIAIAVASFKPEWVFVDAIGAIVVSAMLLFVAGRITFTALFELTDCQAPKHIRQSIYEQSMKIEGVTDAHAIRARHFGSSYIADLHIEVDPNMSVQQAHDISDAVQDTIIKHCDNVIEAIVHIEPSQYQNCDCLPKR